MTKSPPDIPITDCRFKNINNNSKNLNKNICSTDEELAIIKNLIQKLKKGNKRYYNKNEIINDAKDLTNCDSELCVMGSKEMTNFIGKERVRSIKKKIFKPVGPWKDNKWLSNINIDEVLNQWENIYPSYNHISFKMNDTLKNVNCFSILVLS